MEDKQRIGDFFKEQLASNAFEPNDNVWSKIDATLQKKKRKRLLWLWWSSIGLLLLLLLGVFLFSFKGKTAKLTAAPTTQLPNAADSSAASRNTLTKNPLNQVDQNTTDIKSITANNIKNKELTAKNNQGPTLSKPAFNTEISELQGTTVASNQKQEQAVFSQHNATNKLETEVAFSKDSLVMHKQQKQDSLTANKAGLQLKQKKKKKNPTTAQQPKATDTAPNWDISLHFSPVVSNYLKDQHLLLPAALNSKNEVQLSYAYRLLFAIPITEKIKFRFGLGHQEFRYQHQFTASTTAVNEFGGLITDNINNIGVPLPPSLTNAINTASPLRVKHQIKYLQIPLELRHSLKNGKIDVYALYGLDLFVLQDDDISLSSLSTADFSIGRANYLSRLSVAAHTGLALEYGINKLLKLQVEPTINYQIGGYQDQVKHPSPIYLGVYTGLNFRF